MRRIPIIILLALTCVISAGRSPHPQLASQIELACPAGTFVLTSLQTVNPTTGKYRQYGCIDANGNLSMANAVSPGGSNTQVQYNNNGAFGGVAGNWNGVTLSLGASGANAGLTIIGAANRQTFAVSVANNATTIGNSSDNALVTIFGDISIRTTNAASLGTVPAAGVYRYCTDCTTAATCVGSGSGHLAISNGTNWTCQ
jgi:hypothetical protein